MFWENATKAEWNAKFARAIALFDQFFPSEVEAVEAFWILLHNAGIKCPFCQGDRNPTSRGSRIGICIECKMESRLTAQTFFANAKRLRPWLAILFLTDFKLIPSANQFARLLNTAYATAWEILRKTSIVIHADLEVEGALVRSSFFKTSFIRRSRETVTREHPNSEEAAFELADEAEEIRQRNQDDQDDLNSDKEIVVEATEVSPSQALFELLTSEPIRFETLFAQMNLSPSELTALLTVLELEGRAIQVGADYYVRGTGNTNGVETRAGAQRTFALRETEPPKQMTESQPAGPPSATARLLGTVSSALNYIRKVHHGISRKYAQHYLALHWVLATEEDRWGQQELLHACLRTAPLTLNNILDFVSAREVVVGQLEGAQLVQVRVLA